MRQRLKKYRGLFSTKRRLALILIAMPAFFLSCEEETDWNLDTQEVNTIVVEAMLTNEFKTHQIRLTRPITDINKNPEPVRDATVKVFTNQSTYHFSEIETSPGFYASDQPFAATINRKYNLSIETGTDQYTAETYMIPVSRSDLPEVQYIFRRNLYRIVWRIPNYHPDEQAMFEADISWGHLPAHSQADSLTRARLTHFTFTTIDVSHNITQQDKENVFFPKGSIIVFSKYSLSPEYAAYMRALLAETQWQGSLFEDARGNLPGNISNGGLGYFSACSVIRETIVVE